MFYYASSLFFISDIDIKEYHNFLNRKTKATSCRALKRKPIEQQRENVQKDIFLTQDGTRLHFRIFSEKSILTFTEKKDNIEIIENLEKIKCLIQDRYFFNPQKKIFQQQLRYFTAEKGSYIYPSHKFVTDSINLNFFEIPGDSLPDDMISFEPYLKGFAKEVSFSLTEKSPRLTAKHFQASFDLEREIR